MYNTKWDVEWKAHIVYEPEVIKDIIETYKKYANLENPEQVFMLAKFYGGFLLSTKTDFSFLIQIANKQLSI